LIPFGINLKRQASFDIESIARRLIFIEEHVKAAFETESFRIIVIIRR
jgi:hypothetical protein